MKRIVCGLGVLLVMVAAVTTVLADEQAEGRAGRAEMRFMQGMIDHHQMALDMAEDCLANAAGDELKTLCQAVIDAQSAEIRQMQAWLKDWYGIVYNPVSMATMMQFMPEDMTVDGVMLGGMVENAGHGAMGHGGMPEGMDPPMMMGMMAGLSRLEGQEYNVAWMEAMIDHHDDALNMAERLLQRGQHDELLALARQIIADQTAEIKTLEGMIEKQSG
ncbi:MAG: DUF305 domain-containing protein [Chloroflexi bacterium]|nr:DUF305 domain-containing protein [Chloroflexota bacterium]